MNRKNILNNFFMTYRDINNSLKIRIVKCCLYSTLLYRAGISIKYREHRKAWNKKRAVDRIFKTKIDKRNISVTFKSDKILIKLEDLLE